MSRLRRAPVSATAVALALISGCDSQPRMASERATDLERLLPEATTLKAWRAAEGPVDYGPENLYEYLDGGAERYLGHGFRRLVHVRYRLGANDSDSVSLDLFDMGSELGAFGIYSSIRPLEASFQRWGAEGYRSGNVAAAWKGRLFVHGEADSEQAPILEMLERVVRGACERAEGGDAPPTLLAVLPAQGLVARSERVVAADLLGHQCLPGGVVATYAGEGGSAELFFSDLGAEPRAATALAELRAHYGQAQGGVGAPLLAGVDGFSFRDPWLGRGALIATGRFVAGVHGTLSIEAQKSLLAALRERLAALPPGASR